MPGWTACPHPIDPCSVIGRGILGGEKLGDNNEGAGPKNLGIIARGCIIRGGGSTRGGRIIARAGGIHDADQSAWVVK